MAEVRMGSKVFASDSREKIMHREEIAWLITEGVNIKRRKSAVGISIMRHEHCEGM